MRTSEVLNEYHINLLKALTRRQRANDTWRTQDIVRMLNDRFQILLLQIMEAEREEPYVPINTRIQLSGNNGFGRGVQSKPRRTERTRATDRPISRIDS